ncbi:MAG: cytochrome c oxidase assembly protein [Gemmatimonadetes bacterium]|nr:cytochrome c oxidase assembly protein [Gemmatimonadota bacterium]
MQWWCAAQNVAWSWEWTAYPGVWLFMLAIALAWARARRARAWTADAGEPVHRENRRRRESAAFFTGWLLIWIVLDWPVGALGAGYLASVHMIQFLVLALVAPPLLIPGWPAAAEDGAPATGAQIRFFVRRQPLFERYREGGRVRATKRLVRWITHPVAALGVFTAIIIATHLPVTTDRLMPVQSGAFAIDMAWLAGGLLFWWPLIRSSRQWFTRPLKIAYLFALMVLMTAPGAMITFSDLPIYATYELAPPIPGITPLEDQRIAGIGMRLGGSLVCWIAISILFLRWARSEERLLRRELEPHA